MDRKTLAQNHIFNPVSMSLLYSLSYGSWPRLVTWMKGLWWKAWIYYRKSLSQWFKFQSAILLIPFIVLLAIMWVIKKSQNMHMVLNYFGFSESVTGVSSFARIFGMETFKDFNIDKYCKIWGIFEIEFKFKKKQFFLYIIFFTAKQSKQNQCWISTNCLRFNSIVSR